MKIIRLFPRKTAATPDDDLAIINRLPSFWDTADEVHISVSWDEDRPIADKLEREWRFVAPVKVGGPAYGDAGGEFVPGMYVKRGYTITSRGCPNSCWFCRAWKNEGHVMRELKIHEGYNVLDNNLLACSLPHQQAVFEMLEKQPEYPEFTGGLEAARFTPYHAEWMRKLKPGSAFFAYDEPSDWEPFARACQYLREAGMLRPHTTKRFGCYVLIGYRNDTLDAAQKRLDSVINLGVRTQAMLFERGIHSSDSDKYDKWCALRKHYTDAGEVGKRIQAVWGLSEITNGTLKL